MMERVWDALARLRPVMHDDEEPQPKWSPPGTQRLRVRRKKARKVAAASRRANRRH